MRSMTVGLSFEALRASQLRSARRSPSGRASTSVLAPGAGRSQSNQSRPGLSRSKCGLPSSLEMGMDVVTSSALPSGRQTGAAAPFSSLVTACASPGPRSGSSQTCGLGPRAGGIHADEGQGAIVGTDRGRGIAAVPEGQLLGLRVGVVEVDAPQMGAVFVGRLAFGIGGRIGVDALHAVDRERSVGRNGNAGDVANLEDVGAGNRLLAGGACQHGKDGQTQNSKKSPHEGDYTTCEETG